MKEKREKMNKRNKNRNRKRMNNKNQTASIYNKYRMKVKKAGGWHNKVNLKKVENGKK